MHTPVDGLASSLNDEGAGSKDTATSTTTTTTAANAVGLEAAETEPPVDKPKPAGEEDDAKNMVHEMSSLIQSTPVASLSHNNDHSENKADIEQRAEEPKQHAEQAAKEVEKTPTIAASERKNKFPVKKVEFSPTVTTTEVQSIFENKEDSDESKPAVDEPAASQPGAEKKPSKFTVKKVESASNEAIADAITKPAEEKSVPPVEPVANKDEAKPAQPPAPAQGEPTERKISKFTVKKVELNTVAANNASAANQNGAANPSANPPGAGANAAADAQAQPNAVVDPSKSAGDSKPVNPVAANATESNANASQANQPSKPVVVQEPTEVNEDEKPIDESPDKRFLKYDIEIGHGSFKTVYKGLDTESGVPVAWCELHDRKFSKAERTRFIEEAEMLKQLQHPNIVRFYDYWEDTKTKPKKIILVTELMTSGSLKAYVQRFKKQEKSKRLKVIKNFANQILKGLAYLHGRTPPVIHRDLKCDNVFVTGQCGQVKIGDLGLATLKKASFAKSVIGTPEFMAPEMYTEQYDESIDVYAFGMCLLEMATGEYPYQECTKPFEIYKRVTQGIRPENYNKIDNEDLRELIDSCIRLKKNQRPTVKELVNHSWFMESNGLKLELCRDEKTKMIIHTNDTHVTFRLRVTDKAKRKVVWPENEEIEFTFDVDNDDPEQTVKELRESGKIADDDIRYLTQVIKDKCEVFKLEREDRQEEENTSLTSNASTNGGASVNNTTGTNAANTTDANNQQLSQQQAAQQAQTNQAQTIQMQGNSVNFVNQATNQGFLPATNTNLGNMNQQGQQNMVPMNNILQVNNPPQRIVGMSVQFMTNEGMVGPNSQSHVPQTYNQQQQQTGYEEDTILKEVPIKLTLKDLVEMAETVDTPNIEQVDCILELEGRKISFRFLIDSPQELANELIASLSRVVYIEKTNGIYELMQNVIGYVNQNKKQQLIQNKQFHSNVLIKTKYLKQQQKITENKENAAYPPLTNDDIALSVMQGGGGGANHNSNYQQHNFNKPVNYMNGGGMVGNNAQVNHSLPHQPQSLITNEKLEHLAQRQQQMNNELQQMQSQVDMNSNNSTSMSAHASLNKQQFQQMLHSQKLNHQKLQHALAQTAQHAHSTNLNLNFQQAHHYQQPQHHMNQPGQVNFMNNNGPGFMGPGQQSYPSFYARSGSIQDCRDKHEFEMPLMKNPGQFAPQSLAPAQHMSMAVTPQSNSQSQAANQHGGYSNSHQFSNPMTPISTASYNHYNSLNATTPTNVFTKQSAFHQQNQHTIMAGQHQQGNMNGGHHMQQTNIVASMAPNVASPVTTAHNHPSVSASQFNVISNQQNEAISQNEQSGTFSAQTTATSNQTNETSFAISSGQASMPVYDSPIIDYHNKPSYASVANSNLNSMNNNNNTNNNNQVDSSHQQPSQNKKAPMVTTSSIIMDAAGDFNLDQADISGISVANTNIDDSQTQQPFLNGQGLNSSLPAQANRRGDQQESQQQQPRRRAGDEKLNELSERLKYVLASDKNGNNSEVSNPQLSSNVPSTAGTSSTISTPPVMAGQANIPTTSNQNGNQPTAIVAPMTVNNESNTSNADQVVMASSSLIYQPTHQNQHNLNESSVSCTPTVGISRRNSVDVLNTQNQHHQPHYQPRMNSLTADQHTMSQISKNPTIQQHLQQLPPHEPQSWMGQQQLQNHIYDSNHPDSVQLNTVQYYSEAMLKMLNDQQQLQHHLQQQQQQLQHQPMNENGSLPNGFNSQLLQQHYQQFQPSYNQSGLLYQQPQQLMKENDSRYNMGVNGGNGMVNPSLASVNSMLANSSAQQLMSKNAPYLEDIFTRHRRELHELLMRQQTELHEYLKGQGK